MSVPGKYLNSENIMKKVFDETTDSLRITGAGSGPSTVIISSSDDSIAIGNVNGDLMTVNPDGSTNVNIVGAPTSGGRLPVDIGGATVNITGPVTVSNEVEIKNDVGNPIPVNGTVNVGNFPTSQNVVVTSSALPSGAATSANQTTANASLSSIDSKLTGPLPVTGTVDLSSASLAALESITVQNGAGASSVNIQDGGNSITVDGVFFQPTQPISAASLPLPAGASTSSNQTTANASLSSIDSKLTSPLVVTGPLTDIQLRANPVPVSGTVTANLGTISGVATEVTLGLINTKIPTGLTVKAASTPAVATDTALVVVISPNNPITAIISNPSIEISNDVGNPVPVNGTVTANIGTTNGLALDASVNTLLKPSSTLAAVTSITNTVTIKADTLANQTTALKVNDGLGSIGVNGNLNLVTLNTAYEAKVNASRLTSRKSLTIQALDRDLYWGYSNLVTSSNGTLLYKGQFIEFACDPGSTFQIWLSSTLGNVNARIAEST